MTGKYQPKKGDRVEVVLRGKVRHVHDSGAFQVGASELSERTNLMYPDAEHVVSIEKLPDLEPEYIPGEVYEDAGGVLFLRLTEGQWMSFAGKNYPHDYPARPLVRLVPETKVQP